MIEVVGYETYIDYSANMLCGKWFEPRGISYLFSVMVRVRVVFRKTVVGDWTGLDDHAR